MRPGRKKLSAKEKKLAGKYITEEKRTGKYKPKQAVAIGISRAKKQVLKTRKKRRRK